MSSHLLHKQPLWAQLRLSGDVQGSGIRPTIARLAKQYDLVGSVRNCRWGVAVEVAGERQQIDTFFRQLLQLDANAQLEFQGHGWPDGFPSDAFVIGESQLEGLPAVTLPVDRVTCDDCLRECFADDDRRARYALIGCAVCGPRYSMIESLPYDRTRTSLAEFPPCAECLAEYHDLSNRRFHAQSIACGRCGPHVWYEASGAATTVARISDPDQALAEAADALRHGKIVAVKGVGGYQLLCDATNPASVHRLRTLKGRPVKPLAVMVKTVAAAGELAELTRGEAELLQSPAGPIVVARATRPTRLAPNLAFGLVDIGVMLPTTAMHAMLLRHCQVPLVVTSGNREGEPIVFETEQAGDALRHLADGFLHHNRRILQPIDDAVVRWMADRAVTLRAGRGMAPLNLAVASMPAAVALGGQQKSAIALSNGDASILAPHVGDLSTAANRHRYLQLKQRLQTLYQCQPTGVAHDLHADYFTTQLAEELQPLPATAVQHHHAHVVAGMLEHGWLDREVLGFAFDGTGLGSDGTLWGGEVLRATRTGSQRVGHWRPFRLAGGDVAARQPWRVAVALLGEATRLGTEEIAKMVDQPPSQVRMIERLLASQRLSTVTSSAGRIFDAVACLVCGVTDNAFEGDAPMRLEAACAATADGAYELGIDGTLPLQIDWRPLVRQIVQDRLDQVPSSVMAWRFHRAVADVIIRLAGRYDNLPVVLSGGVFQNRVLVELIAQGWRRRPTELGLPHRIPVNDGGLAVGQLLIAQQHRP